MTADEAGWTVLEAWTVREAWTPSVSILRHVNEVYAYLAGPQSFGDWASGLGKGLRRVGDNWFAETESGPVTIRFTPANPHRILDHWVTPAEGPEVYVPMRLIENGDGCEVLITIFREPDWTEEKLAADLAWIAKDLASLKRIMEERRPR